MADYRAIGSRIVLRLAKKKQDEIEKSRLNERIFPYMQSISYLNKYLNFMYDSWQLNYNDI